MKKIKLLAVVMVLAMTMTMFTGCLDGTGSTSTTNGGTATATDDYDDDDDYNDNEDEDDFDNSETLNTSGSSTSSGSSSSSGSSTLSDREICEKVYNYAIANQKYDDLDGVTAKRSLSRTSVYRDAGDTCLVGLDVDFYEGGEAGSGVLDIYWCNKKTGQIKYIDSFQDGPGDSEIDMKTGAYNNPYSSSSSDSSSSSSTSNSSSVSSVSSLDTPVITNVVDDSTYDCAGIKVKWNSVSNAEGYEYYFNHTWEGESLLKTDTKRTSGTEASDHFNDGFDIEIYVRAYNGSVYSNWACKKLSMDEVTDINLMG